MSFFADHIAWVDFETSAPGIDLRAVGTFRYAAEMEEVTSHPITITDVSLLTGEPVESLRTHAPFAG